MSVPEINPTSLILKNFDDGKGEKERKDNEKRKKEKKERRGKFLFLVNGSKYTVHSEPSSKSARDVRTAGEENFVPLGKH